MMEKLVLYIEICVHRRNETSITVQEFVNELMEQLIELIEKMEWFDEIK